MLKAAYHRLVPDRIRVPFGRARRAAFDRLRRALVVSGPLPDAALRIRSQQSPSVGDYLRAGRASAESLRRIVAGAGIASTRRARILEIGCGTARTLRHLRQTAWELHGFEPDPESARWASAAFPSIRIESSAPDPPLPWPSGRFDVVFAPSLLPHLPPARLPEWRDELARLLPAGGLALLGSLGPAAEGARPSPIPAEGLARDRSGEPNDEISRTAFQSPHGIAQAMAPRFEMLRWEERALEGLYDLTLLRRC
ncbi:MAG TPA: class I SAM-dependent methyltransferase [Thermoanaerobaculia bacterium]|nr:class I SAM-dependent methyltransferase [Thermoanaerobaculia bacterium]